MIVGVGDIYTTHNNSFHTGKVNGREPVFDVSIPGGHFIASIIILSRVKVRKFIL